MPVFVQPPRLADSNPSESRTVPAVVAVAGALGEETLPAASAARTVYVCAVAGKAPRSLYEVTDPREAICTPPRKTVYPVTPTLSVAAVQVRSTRVGDADV